MGRHRVYENAAARKAAHRARVRAEQGKPAILTPTQRRAALAAERAATLAAIRRELIRCHGKLGARTFERLYSAEASANIVTMQE
jgi:hypothetical protein